MIVSPYYSKHFPDRSGDYHFRTLCGLFLFNHYRAHGSKSRTRRLRVFLTNCQYPAS